MSRGPNVIRGLTTRSPSASAPLWQTTIPTTGVPSGRLMRTIPEAISSGAPLVNSRKSLRTSFAFSNGYATIPAQHRADRVELVLEGGGDAKVPATTPYTPE